MLRYLPVAEWPAELEDLRDGFAGQLNVYGVMAQNPALLRAWAAFRDHVVVHSALDPQFSQVVILRTGVRLGAVYEWNHHVVRARRAGLEDSRIGSIRGPLSAMSAPDRILCATVDQLFESKGIDAATHRDLTHLVGTRGVLDVMATVTHYMMLGFMLNSVAVPLDASVAAELAVRPPPD